MTSTPAQPDVIELPGLTRTSGHVTLDYMTGDDLLPMLLDGGPVRDHLVGVIEEADALVPDGVEWRIHITGDLVQSVNELDPAYATTPYTLERGANTVAGKTVTQPDGTFDVLLSPIVWAEPEGDDPVEVVVQVLARVRHTVLHEAGHVAIDARGEDTLDIFPTIDHLHPSEAVWSRHLGFMLEDYRIEVGLRDAAPNPHSWAASIGGDLEHFERERSRSHDMATRQGDYGAGRDVMIEATVHLTRALAYLAAEVADPAASLTGDARDRWERFVAPTWDQWQATYGRAVSAYLPMEPDDVADVIADLSALAPALMESVGFVREFNEDGSEGAYWLHEFEW